MDIKKIILGVTALVVIFVCFNTLPDKFTDTLRRFPHIIGRGGYGEIRTDNEGDRVIKLSKKINACLDYKKEFKIHQDIFNAFTNLSHPQAFSRRASILKPGRYVEEKDHCFYEMERLRPMDNTAKLLDQLYLGEDNYDKKVADDQFIRGRYIGLKQTKTIVDQFPPDGTRSNIDQLHYNFGRLLALVHLAAKYDTFDFEFVIAQGTHYYKIAIIDFDKMNSIANLFEGFKKDNIPAIVKKVEWPMAAEQFLPSKKSEHYQHFKQGYLDLATQLNKRDKTNFYTEVANAILDIDWE